MNKLIFGFALIIFTLSCASDDSSISENLNQSGKNIYASGNDIYVTGNVQHIGTVDEDGNLNPDEPGITPHYWKNGQIFDLPGGPVFDNYWVGGGRDIVVEDGQIIVGGWASSSSQAQVAAVWIDSELFYLKDKDKFFSVVNSIDIQ